MLHVDTDAPVPVADASTITATTPPPLFDRLRVDIDGLRQDFAVDDDGFRSERISFGIALPVGESGHVARLRLYGSVRAIEAEPPASTVIEANVLLPMLERTGTLDLYVTLRTDDVGVVAAPIEPSRARPGASLVGTWAGATVRPCVGRAGPTEVCVPGGAFFFGDAALATVQEPSLGGSPIERLTIVSPFFIDTDEVAVGQIRERMALYADNPGIGPIARSSAMPRNIQTGWCSYSVVPEGRETFAVTCIPRLGAQRYCEAEGKTLPSEAQFEFLASGRGREQAFVWGDDLPACEEAVFARSDPRFVRDGTGDVLLDCNPFRLESDAVARRSGKRDIAALSEDARVYDLGGGATELTLDPWNPTFASGSGILRDPIADADPNFRNVFATRGGSWTGSPFRLRAAYRIGHDRQDAGPAIGFRCARKDSP